MQGFQHKQHKQAYGFKKNFDDESAFHKHFADNGIFGKHLSGRSGGFHKESHYKVINNCIQNLIDLLRRLLE